MTIGLLEVRSGRALARFGGSKGKMFYLERIPVIGDNVLWETVAGPAAGADLLLELEDPQPISSNAFYRLRGVPAE